MVEIIQLVIITFLVPWNVALTWMVVDLGKANAALSATASAKAGSPCALHDGVVYKINSKLDKLAENMAELTGFLRTAGHDGAPGEHGPRGDKGDRG